jgi:hypothetical protein
MTSLRRICLPVVPLPIGWRLAANLVLSPWLFVSPWLFLSPWLLVQPRVLAVPSDGIGTPLPTRVERFDPDPEVCRPQAIRDSFARQLQPWSDQPPAVLERLRQLQLEMTRNTLRRCVSRGLMEPAEATRLEQQLGLVAGPAPLSPAPAPAGSP